MCVPVQLNHKTINAPFNNYTKRKKKKETKRNMYKNNICETFVFVVYVCHIKCLSINVIYNYIVLFPSGTWNFRLRQDSVIIGSLCFCTFYRQILIQKNFFCAKLSFGNFKTTQNIFINVNYYFKKIKIYSFLKKIMYVN